MEPYSIFIPVAPKDAHKIKYLVRSIIDFVPGWSEIILTVDGACEVSELAKAAALVKDREFTIYNQDAVLPFEQFKRCSYRPTWIYQQCLKLFQNVTRHDLFLTIDSDVIFNRPLRLFTNEGKRIWNRGWEQNFAPYYEFNRRILGLEREFGGTFLFDCNFFDKKIIADMLERGGYTQQSFIEKTIFLTCDTVMPSEADLYMQYCYKYLPDAYEIRQARTVALGRHCKHQEDTVWPDADIEQEIEKAKGKDIDAVALHSWYSA